MPYYLLTRMDYTNINVIADRITRHKLLTDITFETILDYTYEFIKIVGLPKSMLEKTAIVEIDEYKGELPCDFYKLIQARVTGGSCFRESTDSFHMSPDKEKNGKEKRNTGVTYKVQGRFIFTSIPHCVIEIAYRALPIDENGMPLILDNGTYPRALEEYIKMKCFNDLFDEGKVSLQVLQNRQQQYSHAVRMAESDLKTPSLDMMESITNMRSKLLDSKVDHNNGYVSMGAKQYLRI